MVIYCMSHADGWTIKKTNTVSDTPCVCTPWILESSCKMCLTLVSAPTINWVHDHSPVRSVYGNMADQRIRAYTLRCLKRLCCCKSITYRVILVLSQTGADHIFFQASGFEWKLLNTVATYGVRRYLVRAAVH